MTAAAEKDPLEAHRDAGATVRVDGLRLFYRKAGAGAGPPVVLTHGIPRSSFVFRKIIPLLAKKRSVLAWDLYGAGLSEKPQEQERYSFPEFERVFGLFLDELGIERAHFVCHDVGGPYTLGFAARHPERVASLTVMNTTLTVAGFRIPTPVAASVLLPPKLQTTLLPDAKFADFLYSYMRRRAHASPDSLSDAEAETDRRLLLLGGGRIGLIRTLRAYRTVLDYFTTVRNSLAGFSRPGLVLWGERDPFCRLGAARRISKLTGAPIATIPAASHYLQEDEPDAVARAVLERIAETGE
jgi:pimeloyl-ACP methyl ester carboxylesterase